MSESQKPSGNRPPGARVFRPFTGGTTGQGNQQPSSPPPAAKRPSQPFKPFAGAQRPSVVPTEPQHQPTPISVAAFVDEPAPTPAAPIAAVALEPAVETPQQSTPEPTYLEREPAPIAHEAWERYVAPEIERLSEPPAVLVAQTQNPEITAEVPQVVDDEPELKQEQSNESVSPYRRSSQPITIEVPAIPSEEAMAAIRDVASEGEFWEAAYASTPATPTPEPTKEKVEEVVIDEVEAAFESAQPSSDSSRLAEVLVAAATLETIARRLRNGEVDLRPAPGANMSSEETVLATVLAALLANR